MLATAATEVIKDGWFELVSGILLAVLGFEGKGAPKRYRQWRYERLLIKGSAGGPGIPKIIPAGDRIAILEIQQKKLDAGQLEILRRLATNGSDKPIGLLLEDVAHKQETASGERRSIADALGAHILDDKTDRSEILDLIKDIRDQQQ